MGQKFTVTLPGGAVAPAIRVQEDAELPAALRTLGIQHPRPALAVVGGASGMADGDLARVRALFLEALAPAADATNAAVVDGGTDAGVMRLMGQALGKTNGAFPLIGVAVAARVMLSPDADPSPDVAQLEPHHTHFVLVPGTEWGDESPWLANVAGYVAAGRPSLTVLVNGGDVAWRDVADSVELGRPVVVVAGSGRTADQLAAALKGESSVDRRAKGPISSGLLHAVHLDDGPERFRLVIEEFLANH